MGNYTREEILQMVEDEDVEFIRLQFTDMFGAIKNIAVTARELPRALNNQCVIDGEQIAGSSGLKDADLYLRPVLDTFAILPWRPQQGKVARMICDLYFPDGTPYKTVQDIFWKMLQEKRRLRVIPATLIRNVNFSCFIQKIMEIQQR